MGGQPWWYSTHFQESLEQALREVQHREFQAGRYGPVMFSTLSHLPIGDDTKARAPGPDHESIEEARQEFQEMDGTMSILDIKGLSETRKTFYISPYPVDYLQKVLCTTQPTGQQVREQANKLFDPIGRAEGRSLIVYKDGIPDEIMFLGYSAD